MARDSWLRALRVRLAAGVRTQAARLGGDEPQWRRLLQSDPAAAGNLVRAAYVAVLEREPDPSGLRSNTQRLQDGLPFELLLAELARARDVENTAARVAAKGARADAGAEHISDIDMRLARLEEDLAAQRRTLLAVTRRLAVFEDRMQADGAEEDQHTPRSASL